jgi:hypothetical protein
MEILAECIYEEYSSIYPLVITTLILKVIYIHVPAVEALIIRTSDNSCDGTSNESIHEECSSVYFLVVVILPHYAIVPPLLSI